MQDRNLFETAKKAKIPENYQMRLGEVDAILNTMPFLDYVSGAADLAYKAIITAFKYGYVKGCRSERARQKRASK